MSHKDGRVVLSAWVDPVIDSALESIDLLEKVAPKDFARKAGLALFFIRGALREAKIPAALLGKDR